MKAAACVFVIVASAASPALAGPLDYAFGNTVRIENADGVTDYYLNEDGTFSTGAGDSGTWIVDGAQICTMVGEATDCGPYQADRKVGDSWTDAQEDGSVVTVTVIEGR